MATATSQTYSGSRRTFTALLRTMIKKKKIAIALALTRRNSSPIFCAVLPQVSPSRSNLSPMSPRLADGPPGSSGVACPCDGCTNRLCRCQAEKVDEAGWREPPGFHLIPLPFADDIRAAPVETGFRGRHIDFLMPVTSPSTHSTVSRHMRTAIHWRTLNFPPQNLRQSDRAVQRLTSLRRPLLNGYRS